MNPSTEFLSKPSTVANTTNMPTFPKQCNSSADTYMLEDDLKTNTYVQIHRNVSGKSLKLKEKQEEIL